MLAARVPTAISRQDLSRLDAASPRRSPRHQRRAVWEDLWDREVVAYAVVSFCYALGKSLVDAQGNPTHSMHMNTETRKEFAMPYNHGYKTLAKAFAKKHQTLKVRPKKIFP